MIIPLKQKMQKPLSYKHMLHFRICKRVLPLNIKKTVVLQVETNYMVNAAFRISTCKPFSRNIFTNDGMVTIMMSE